jgi:ribose transport system permease protein
VATATPEAPATAPATARTFGDRMRSRLSSFDQGYIVAGVVVVLIAGFSAALDGFFTTGNLLDAARNSSVLGILAVGMAIVVVGRGLDLSLVVIMGVTSQIVSEYMANGHGETQALLLGLAVALILGLGNGVLVAYVEIPALFVTLATSLLYLGFFRLVYLDRLSGRLPDYADFTTTMARSRPLGIPAPVLILLAAVLVAFLLMSRTTLGRFIYAQGDNPAAASLAGIPTRPLTVLTYLVAAFLAFVAGILSLGLAGGFDARAVTTGSQLYDVIAVVVIGGVSLAGGRGSVGGVLAGALLIGVLVNGMTLLDFDTIQQSLWKSVIVLAALVLDAWIHPRDEETARPGEL